MRKSGRTESHSVNKSVNEDEWIWIIAVETGKILNTYSARTESLKKR